MDRIYLELSLTEAQHLYDALCWAIEFGQDWEDEFGNSATPEILSKHNAEMAEWERVKRLIRRRLNRILKAA
jgi:hypothetical protein